MRVLCVVVLFAALVFGVAASAFAQTGMALNYDQYGLGVTLPADSERIPLGDIGGGGMQAAYKSNGLAYIVLASTEFGERGMGARASIEMMVQMLTVIKSKVPDFPVHPLTANTKQGMVAKGFGMSGRVISSKESWSRVPDEIRNMFGNEVSLGVLFVPIVDYPALVGAILVVGPTSRAGDIDSQATSLAGTLVVSRPTSPLFGGAKGPKTAAPPAPEVKSLNQLKKGQIELVGVVKTTDAERKCVDMLVTQAVPFTGHGAIISPPRLKRVFVKDIAEGIKEGVIIVVIAGDTGPGKSVTADTLKLMDMSKMGF